MINYINFIVNELTADMINECNTVGVAWVLKKRKFQKGELQAPAEDGDQGDGEQRRRGAGERGHDFLSLPLSALRCWRKTSDEFNAVNVTVKYFNGNAVPANPRTHCY